LGIKKKFERIIKFLLESGNGTEPVSGIDASSLFNPSDTDEISTARNLIGSFLVQLTGPSSPGYDEARNYILKTTDVRLDKAKRFFFSVLEYIFQEVGSRYDQDAGFRRSLDDLYDYIIHGSYLNSAAETKDKLWKVFFPEGIISGKRADWIESLREKRKVHISSLNRNPIQFPGREVLFTANVLLTIPHASRKDDAFNISADVKEALHAIENEDQLYWYDHPIPLGTEPDKNELLWGMQHLSRAVQFEERRGTKEPGRNIDCVLSVSVTHRGLRRIARNWVESELSRSGYVKDIDLYMFTEDDTVSLLDDILIPAAQRYIKGCDVTPLRDVFGIDGEYGRHYTFLKAIARFWNVLISPETRATFKIDLDQVFPQEELVQSTGASAFQHLTTPLWGALGTDSNGDSVHLGMLAGALVNRNDIASSLFTPDIAFPERGPTCDEWIFRSAVPQALSTEAEMMTSYVNGMDIDGKRSCIQRIHATGGTTGILVESLRRYRPFTPTCIGRAEDQAYLLSVLYKPDEQGYLRYAHEYGLVMRHDTGAFARESPDMERNGKMIGDCVRMLLFSIYARALPWTEGAIKDAVDPFTGCFISRIPVTVACIRFALRAAHLLSSEQSGQGLRFFYDGVNRLSGIIESYVGRSDFFHEIYTREKYGWDLYYETLDVLEQNITEGDPFALQLLDKARNSIKKLRIEI
jgi:hypothetical protein